MTSRSGARPCTNAEHVSFLLLVIVFWAQIVDSPPLRSRLDYPGRVVFAVLGGAASWILAVVLALAPHPLYSYAGHGHISALTDQQLAGGMMWGRLASPPTAAGDGGHKMFLPVKRRDYNALRSAARERNPPRAIKESG
jgi:Cytochrome c oxidase caa3 assembly factor (Caa3_CtaG)